MAYDLAKVTANGNNLIAQILANKSSLSIDKIEISDTQLPSTTDISTMTSVPKVVQTVSANGFSKNSNALIISTVVDNSSIRADYKAWIFGIWGSDSQNGQSQLIAVITSTNSPDTIPAFSGRTPVSYTYKFNIGFSNASQIQFNMIDDSFATNDTVVHTTGDETIDGQKKFKTDPTDSAGNAYAKTVDVNQQLDKKVTDNKDGSIVVNGKTFVPADDSKVVHNSGTEEIGGQKTFDIAPIDKTTGNPYITKDGVPSIPSDVARTGQANTFSLLQTFSQGVKTLQTGSYDDANSLVNEGLYYNTNSSIKNGAGSITTGYIQVMSGYGEIVRQIMYSDTDGGVIYDRTSQNGGSSWGNWVQIVSWDQIPSNMAFTDQSQTFTQPQTFSIAPTITDASQDKGDTQAATMADLKSIEDSAWREIDLSGTSGLYNGKINIKIDDTNKTIYLQGAMYFPSGTSPSQGTSLIDLSKVVNSITSSHGYLFFVNGNNEHATGTSTFAGTASTLGSSNSSIVINSGVQFDGGLANYILPFPDAGKPNIYITYDKLV